MSTTCDSNGQELKRPIDPNRLLQYDNIRFVVNGEPIDEEVLNRALYDLVFEITKNYYDKDQLKAPEGASYIGVDTSNLVNLTDIENVQDFISSIDSSVVYTSRRIDTGEGLVGGGNLTQNREISVDGTVVRTFGDQYIGGKKTFQTPPIVKNFPLGNDDVVNRGYLSSTLSSVMQGFVPTSRSVFALDGVIGGGSLAQDLLLKVDSEYVRNLVLRDVESRVRAMVLHSVNQAINALIDCGEGEPFAVQIVSSPSEPIYTNELNPPVINVSSGGGE